jgi:hypothetical protein
MRTSLVLCSLALSCAAGLAAHSSQAQGFTTASSPTTPSVTSTPLNIADAAMIPDTAVAVPSEPRLVTRHSKGKRLSTEVQHGVLVVDGMVAKVHLNYAIRNDAYLYFFVPGVGTAIVSRVEMPGFERVTDAFQGSSLSFSVSGHSIELTNRHKLTRGRRSDAWVKLDPKADALNRFPMMGFGDTIVAPYAWPLSDVETADNSASMAPPLPLSILPRTERDDASPLSASVSPNLSGK